MSTRLPYPSDFPAFAEDEDPTLVWQRPTFMGIPLKPLPADETLETLLHNPTSTVRRKPAAEQTTVCDESPRRRSA